ncbi:leucine rich repeat protein [Stylonychia lemnae]|uniref:Leucine rich repeat protein n=1 Tax=Stylonychia lemnae TaxID=5949 RepID=A0A078ANT7_STYLE|nr:leucine rich repeat protein [Stylonychia lemnae]|eukprot:CDW83824.1 leucine rich repeat protein [Stylonychia lemnae]
MSQIEQNIFDKVGFKVSPEQFESLILDDQELYDISLEDKAYLESFKCCTYLSLANCKLRLLANLPNLPNLVRLDLSSNQIVAKELIHIANNYLKLETLKLGNNMIKPEWESLKMPLTKLGETLISLDLSANLIGEIQNNYYREQIFELLPVLEVLDGYDKDNKEVYSDNDEDDEYRDVNQKKKGNLRNAQRGHHITTNDDNEESKGEAEDNEEEDEEYDEEDDDEPEEVEDQEEVEGYYEEEEDPAVQNQEGRLEGDEDEEDDDSGDVLSFDNINGRKASYF